MRANGRANEMLSPAVRQIGAAVGGDRDEMRDQRLVELHHVGDVPVRRVQLEHRELGVVRRVDAFVAKDPPDLVDALHPGDDQPLEVQLGRDAQAASVGRGRCSASRTGAPPRRRRRAAASAFRPRRIRRSSMKRRISAIRRLRVIIVVAHVGIDDHVDVALAIALLDVLKPVPLVGQRHQRFSQRRERR